ncbi:MAG: carboxypeptidase regulatory-like domain-containing protein [Candidatus Aminicenantes bacterium]|nr:carboxypeptidase regulatory-like domain-containing protein [Candidatus Aminicenantes bacterium]
MGVLTGQVRDGQNKPIAGVAVYALPENWERPLTTLSNPAGAFGLAGIPSGEVSINLELQGERISLESPLVFEPGRVLYLKIVLASEGNAGVRLHRVETLDLSDTASRTVLGAFQINSLPFAGNVWSLIENQDLSATTNRIDVGGMWSDKPALWSSRGGVSWTQTGYLINGMDVTDPYWRGMPLFHPDVFSLAFSELPNGCHPAASLSPGGELDFLPKKGGPEYHGSVAAFWSAPWMSATNISHRLKAEGLFESNRLSSYQQLNGQLSGPLLPGRLFFSTSLQHLRLDRDMAEFDAPDKAGISSGLLHLTYRVRGSALRLFWTGQALTQPTVGAGRRVPISSTVDRRQLFNVLQVIWETRFRPWHYFKLGASFSRGNTHERFQEGETGPHGLEIFSGIPSGAAPAAGRDDRTVLTLLVLGDLLHGSHGPSPHRLTYGFSLRQGSSASKKDILQNLHLHFFDGRPLEVVRFDGPLEHRERMVECSLFAEETLNFRSLASLSLGIHLSATRGWMPRVESGGKIRWVNLSPRLGFALPLSRAKSSWLRISASRYYFNLPLNYLTHGNPTAPGGLVHAWKDTNGDGSFSEDEAGALLRREGPRFGLIDPDLKRPYTDEYALRYSRVFGRNFYFSLAGFYRETRQLVETLNTGVPLSAYDPFEIYDPGDDTIPGTHDDLYLIVYNQKKETLGQDFFLLTNPEGESRVSRYRGLDLTLVKKFCRSSVFFFSATATEAIGTTSPGNTEWENDDGVVGSLYDTPNASLWSRGRLRFDRAYTARVGLSFPVPRGFRFAVLAKYYDG